MSDNDTQSAKLEKRKEILTELWALVGDPGQPGSVAVAALDRIARIEDAYTPIKVEVKKRFVSLADFYKGVASGVDVAKDVKSERQANDSVPVFAPAPAEPTAVKDEDDDEDFL
jgi:hypothetical protein